MFDPTFQPEAQGVTAGMVWVSPDSPDAVIIVPPGPDPAEMRGSYPRPHTDAEARTLFAEVLSEWLDRLFPLKRGRSNP